MRVFYISDGECGGLLPLAELLANFRASGVGAETINEVRRDLTEGRGFTVGRHDEGQFVVIEWEE